MRAIRECACTKAILCGEHFVVHEEKAIAMPAKPLNCAILKERGKENTLTIIGRTGKALFSSGGKISGQRVLHSFAQVYLAVLQKTGMKKHKGITISLQYSGAPKGMGNSASLACAIAKCLCRYFGLKAGRQELFRLVQLSEKIAHFNPSGIDAKTVTEGKAQVFQRGIGKMPPQFKAIPIHPPKGCAFAIINTASPKGKPAKTSLLVEKFTRWVKSAEGKKATEEYRRIFSSFLAQVTKANPNPKTLGKLMSHNHLLLRKGSVSSSSIEGAIAILARQPSVFGAKLTGAGGKGGAVLALIKRGKLTGIRKSIEKAGLRLLLL